MRAGLIVLADHLKDMSVAGVETRLLAGNIDILRRSISTGVAASVRGAGRIERVGAVLNYGTRLLYVQGQAALALSIVREAEAALSCHRHLSGASALGLQLRINRIRLLRSLGRDADVATEIERLVAHVAMLDLSAWERPDAERAESAAAEVPWLESFKCAWRRNDYDRCLSLALKARRPSLLADESCLRALLELGEYPMLLARVLAEGGRHYSQVYAALALLRGRASAEFYAVVAGAKDALPPGGRLRVGVECAHVLSDDDFASRLFESVRLDARLVGDNETACLAATAEHCLSDHGEPSVQVLVDFMLADRHRVAQFVAAAALLGTRHHAFAYGACKILLDEVDLGLVSDTAAYDRLMRVDASEQLSDGCAPDDEGQLPLLQAQKRTMRAEALELADLCREALTWI